MTQEKMRKLVTAIVSACTILLTLLAGYLAYQWITIAVYKNKAEKLEQKIAYYKELNENAQNDLEYYESDLYKEWEAMKLGFVKGNQ